MGDGRRNGGARMVGEVLAVPLGQALSAEAPDEEEDEELSLEELDELEEGESVLGRSLARLPLLPSLRESVR